MKAIIHGRRYDTETATLVATHDDEAGANPEHTGLYRTRKGAWFLAGSGSAGSRWGDRVNGLWVAGSGVKPQTDEEALRTLEGWNEVSAIETYFSHVVADA